MINLNKNSLNVKLYNWFYNTDTLPTNLCPYFWKLVLMYLLIIPYIVFTIPHYIDIFLTFLVNTINIKLNKTCRVESSNKNEISMLYWISYSIIHSIVYVIIYGTLSSNNILMQTIIIIGFSAIIFFTVLSITFLICYILFHPKSNVLITFIKAKYNKYCPIINWEDKKKYSKL